MADDDAPTPGSPGPGEPSPPITPDPLQTFTAEFRAFRDSLDARLSAIESAQAARAAPTPASPPPRALTPEDIERAYENRQITEVERIQYLADLRARELIAAEREVQHQAQRLQGASAEIEQYRRLIPALNDGRSAEIQRVNEAIRRMAQRGLAQYGSDGLPTTTTVVEALERVFGPVEEVRLRQQNAQYTSERLPVGGAYGTGGGGEPPAGGKANWQHVAPDIKADLLKVYRGDEAAAQKAFEAQMADGKVRARWQMKGWVR